MPPNDNDNEVEICESWMSKKCRAELAGKDEWWATGDGDDWNLMLE